MKKLMISLSMTLIVMLSVNSVYAADVEITWTEPDKYQDIRPSNENKKKFRKRIFKEFEKHFSEMATSLPEDQKLMIEVTDVSLAGDVRFNTRQDIRVIKRQYFPKMKFSYKLVNSDSSSIQEANVDLKDMGFMTSSINRYKNTSIAYEKKMLDNWFKKEFAQYAMK